MLQFIGRFLGTFDEKSCPELLGVINNKTILPSTFGFHPPLHKEGQMVITKPAETTEYAVDVAYVKAYARYFTYIIYEA